MKKLALLVAAIFAMSFSSFAEVDPYVANDNAIEQAFAAAEEVSFNNMDILADQPILGSANTMSVNNAAFGSANPWGAWALCTFLGGFGIHRHYMGTSNWMWAIYTFTVFGIFGVVPFVDWVVLLVGAIENNIGSYTGNDKFFMWL